MGGFSAKLFCSGGQLRLKRNGRRERPFRGIFPQMWEGDWGFWISLEIEAVSVGDYTAGADEALCVVAFTDAADADAADRCVYEGEGAGCRIGVYADAYMAY